MAMEIQCKGIDRKGRMLEYEIPLKDGTKVLGFESAQKILQGYKEIQIDVPLGVENIGYGCFIAFEDLSAIRLPNTVKKISEKAFMDCKKLKRIRLSQQLEEVGNEAFARCEELTDLALPSSLKLVENLAFVDCKSLRNVVFQKRTYAKISGDAFWGCPLSDELLHRIKIFYHA